MTAYFTGKGYGISNLTDITGRPLLTYQGPNDKRPFLLSDRVAQTFDFTIRQPLTAGAAKNARMPGDVSNFIKSKLGGVPDDELDHKIALELGGSNAPANLMLQPGRKSGVSAASDELENVLALDVTNGKISLLDAWRTLAEQKGFLLGEDSKIGTTFSFTALASQIFSIAKNAEAGPKTQNLSQQARLLREQMAEDIEKLKQDPLNQPLQTKIFSDNVKNLMNTAGMTQSEAATTTKSFLASYAQSKGIDPRELMGSLNANVQQIIENSKRNPNIFGVPSTAITKVVLVLQSLSQLGVYAGLIISIIGIFLAGPEVILGALSGGLLESIGAIFGVSALTGIGLTSFAVGEALSIAAIGLNMTTKQMYDNGYLLPTQNISALKEAIAVQKGLAAFLPSLTTETAAKTTKPVAVARPKVFSGIVSQGTLGEKTEFFARQDDIIDSLDDLQEALQNNLTPFLATIPGRVIYELKIVSRVVSKDGFVQTGTTQTITTGTRKDGSPIKKTLTNKFAVVYLYFLTDKGTRAKISTIVLGPTDAVKFRPQPEELTKIEATIKDLVIAKDLSEVRAVTPSPIIQAAAAPEVAPAATQPTPPAAAGAVPLPVAPPPVPEQPAAAPLPVTPPATPKPPTITTPTPKLGADANTLYEWYTAQGQSLPSVSARAPIYESFGLGPASLYVGTAEQNTKLLAELKAR